MVRLVINNPLMLQLLEKLADIGSDLGRVRNAELRLQFFDDLPECPLAVAAFEYLQTGALQPNRAFRKKHHAILLRATPAAAGCQARLAGILRRGHPSCPRCGTHPAAAIPVQHKQSRVRQAVPTECRTCRAVPGLPTPVRLASSHCRKRSSRRIENLPAPDRAEPQNNPNLPPARDNAGAVYPRAK